MSSCVYLRWFLGPVIVKSWSAVRGRTLSRLVPLSELGLVLMAADGASNRDIEPPRVWWRLG